MEHKNEEVFKFDVIDAIEEKVQELAEVKWSRDNCPPEFWISLNNEDMNNQSIMITINHNNCKFTEVLFPRKDTEYGYDCLLNQLISMYNQTL